MTGRPGSSGRPARPEGSGGPERADGPGKPASPGRQGGSEGQGRAGAPGAGRARPDGAGGPQGAGKARSDGPGRPGGGKARSDGAGGPQGGGKARSDGPGRPGAGRPATPGAGKARPDGAGGPQGAGRARSDGAGGPQGGGKARSDGPGRPGGPQGVGKARPAGPGGPAGTGKARPDGPGRPGGPPGAGRPGRSARPEGAGRSGRPPGPETSRRPRSSPRPEAPHTAPGRIRPGAGRGEGQTADPGRTTGRGGRPPRPPVRPPAVLRLGNPGRRINVGLIAMTFVLSIFAGRLVQLQGLDSKVYAAEAAEQRVRGEKLTARRGSITDVNGHELALTLEAREIFVDPSEVAPADRDRVATALAAELNLPKEQIAAKLGNATSRYQQVAAAVEPSVAQRIMEHKPRLKGVGSKHRYRRDYPGGDLAGTLLGFVGDDGTGLSGLENTYNGLLAGRDGEQFIETGREGQRIPMTRSTLKTPVEGRDVRLTVERDIQWAAQKAITDQVKATGARTGSAIVIDVPTGQVVAMANAPELDLKNWEKTAPEDWVNRSVTDVFEPGSTNKVITAAAALESGAVRPETVFKVPDNITCADRVLRDSHPHPVERLTFSGVVATSSNVGTILASQRVGDEKLHAMLERFGFGAKPGTGLLGEEAGLLPDWRKWSGSQRCTIAYGQGVSVTALQTASVYQTIANGGVRVTPQIVAGTTAENGAFVPSPAGKQTRVVSERTAREVSGMLEAAVSDEGTGNLAAIDGYRVAGKTGTAMRYDPKCQGYCGYTSTFVGFAPADKPRLVVLAVIQDPHKGYYGGEIAAPVFKKVMTFALKSKKIPPTGTTPASVRIRAGE
ncbi:penicillin-binding transpeptidase domain-containing protein [Streptosporangium canum]|uniref:penicillin-binding transpeptidase domain-containing protein n=1 Tax=Streptosporangium canum TaxID=324952 RepID=UPI00343D7416